MEELLWFIEGYTNATELSFKEVRFWHANESYDFLDGLGFSSAENFLWLSVEAFWSRIQRYEFRLFRSRSRPTAKGD